ncbi:MAG: bifunctional diaminohydroxyphosphoribosylaminopyrimidine deaminase/5-amino-6-(5-phosphoribosylamino)uracil reductase RibD [Planctomycetota bacterium]|nr:bifunctional diaminohydroxyphosphoribosylaminopyrimidine deaminase/5-amino-6-(5-phosphoribosylamino)uracil reductase RibD [Planctomycetota bacterium]
MNADFTEANADFMRRALKLAENGEGRVSPNPPVGCLLVRDGNAVGEGWHDRLGDSHAEAMALRQAGPRARGATVYVTLSPCVVEGRQPPCVPALIAAGVARVIAAAEDPNPDNSSGLEQLRQAGIPAVSGLLKEEAEYLSRGFFKSRLLGLPHLTLKYAMTLDGKTASVTGESRWISGPASREAVQDLRSRSDAVLVGSGTALRDDPLLNVRNPAWIRRGGPGRHPQPRRVIVDSLGRLSPIAAMFSPEFPGGGVIVAVTDLAPREKLAALEKAGAEIYVFSPADGRVPLEKLLRRLCGEGVNLVLCEGGGELSASLLEAGLVDEIWSFVAPKLLGGRKGPGAVGGRGIPRLTDAPDLAIREYRAVGGDLLIRAGPLKPAWRSES